jgi:transposase-like protein|tara:strand:- start:298 stop:753 length:456 start_codon:yes stop_codon:yes gene_type:complete
VPPYLRKAKSVEELLPWLYLKGISTGDFSEALASLVGPDADEYGNKDVLGIMDGFHENADSWRDLLGILKKRGLTIAPDLACGDGVMGFWTALRDVYPTTKEQRCWVHKMANITGAMPKPMHEKAKAGLQDICPLGYARMPCQVIDGRDEE